LLGQGGLSTQPASWQQRLVSGDHVAPPADSRIAIYVTPALGALSVCERRERQRHRDSWSRAAKFAALTDERHETHHLRSSL